ncbi:hypothetical protein T484DRAFT_1752349 [Baffinella frigidus]|nr:hypothetical protein T484DRAFT_1752349 [Cryptophyta sp. CCMP2293]
MPWRDIIFTGDGIILPPSWTQSGMDDVASFATGGIVRPPSISEEERVLLDMLAPTGTHFEAKPRSPAKRPDLLDLLYQTETHFQAKARSPSNATGEANTDAFSTATTPCMSRTASLETDTSSQNRRSSLPRTDERAELPAEPPSCTALGTTEALGSPRHLRESPCRPA